MSTPWKSTSHMATPATPRRPCTPESIHGRRSPRAPGPPGSPDRRSTSGDQPTKSYLRPTVSSVLHHGNINTHQPRRSIDKPPFLPPSSMGINTQHHKNPSSSSKGSLSLKGILTRATNVMKGANQQRKTSTSAGINIGKGSGSSSSTPVRSRSPATLPKSRNFARSNSVPKKMGIVNKKEKDTMSIGSIEDNFTEHLPDPVEITPHEPQNLVQSTTPQVAPQEPCYTEKIEDDVHDEIVENSIVATDVNMIDVKEPMVFEVNESPKGISTVKVIEACREEQPVMEGEVQEIPKETESEVVVEKQEEEVPDIESVDVVEEFPQQPENVFTVEEQESVKPEETVTELPKEPDEDEVVVAGAEEETKEEPKESEDNKEIKEEVETQDKIEEEKLAVEPETKEETGTLEETPNTEARGDSVEEVPKVEEKPIVTEIEDKKEEVVVETPKDEEKPVSTIVPEPKKEKATIRKPDAIATRSEGTISNDVIEETKIKLMETRKNKVLALAGAFETIMQKPEGSTRR